MMKTYLFCCILATYLLSSTSCYAKKTELVRSIPVEVLKDKIAGGWAGKMIGVSYGVPTEFEAHGFTFEDSIKWTSCDICGAGSTYNIDAKLNGAYIVIGLLYGEGNPLKTMEIATRCGQDSDCNPSSAMGILGVVKGFKAFPAEYRRHVLELSDSLFINTDYSFNKAILRSVDYAKASTIKNGGQASDVVLRIKTQTPIPGTPEFSFPSLIFDRRVTPFVNGGWKFKGNWAIKTREDTIPQSRFSSNAGDEATFTFEGTGVSIAGNWDKNCGKADIYVDGKFKRTIDCYFNFAGQSPGNTSVFMITGLPEQQHTVRIVVKNEKRAEAEGANIYLSEAVIFKTGDKIKKDYKFSFQK